ncbi:MAG: N-acetylmuramoyl-L-alanine amidase [Succinatimonas sp.]|nr:N-acetylmuramoyl-L-alanine amidase [Succinatimonas sp.]
MKLFISEIIKSFLCIVLCTSISIANATEIKSLRSYVNTDKTRVVIDVEKKPVYTTALSIKNFNIRIKNLNNAKNAPQKISFNDKSCLMSVNRALDGNDVRYLFARGSCGEPEYFLLEPQKGTNNYRIVIDFPHSGSGNSAIAQSSDTRTLKEQERDLFIACSTASKDGLRTMTKEQADDYSKKLAKLREDYAKQTVAQQKAQAKRQAQNLDSETVADAKAPPSPVQAMPIARPFIIAIDAGHGGKDPGAIGRRGVREKNVTLAISQALTKYINSNPKFRGVLTRNKDIFLSLDARSEIARKRKADLLISIHADSVASNSSSARGVSVWVLSENRASRENGKILKNNQSDKLLGGASEVLEQSVGNPYLAATILDMSSTNTRSEGYLLGTEILKKLGNFTHVKKSTPVHASLAVLKAPDIPSLLVETGYLSNRYEEIQLNQPNYQKQIAYHIYQGIKSYYEKYPAKKLQSRVESAVRSRSSGKSVVVKAGDSLSAIASRYKTSVGEIKRVNSLTTNVIHKGQTLYLP